MARWIQPAGGGPGSGFWVYDCKECSDVGWKIEERTDPRTKQFVAYGHRCPCQKTAIAQSKRMLAETADKPRGRRARPAQDRENGPG